MPNTSQERLLRDSLHIGGKRWNRVAEMNSETCSEMPKVIGRGGEIRTRDPLHPMQVRYQAALRPDL